MESFMDEQDQTIHKHYSHAPIQEAHSLLDWTTYFTVVMIAWGSFSLLPFGSENVNCAFLQFCTYSSQ